MILGNLCKNDVSSKFAVHQKKKRTSWWGQARRTRCRGSARSPSSTPAWNLCGRVPAWTWLASYDGSLSLSLSLSPFVCECVFVCHPPIPSPPGALTSRSALCDCLWHLPAYSLLLNLFPSGREPSLFFIFSRLNPKPVSLCMHTHTHKHKHTHTHTHTHTLGGEGEGHGQGEGDG